MKEDTVVEASGFSFAVEPNVKKFTRFLGQLSIDYRKSRFFGNGFEIRFSGSKGCC